jgi:hypothetical protein
MALTLLTLNINGEEHQVPIPDHWTLLEALRYRLILTGTLGRVFQRQRPAGHGAEAAQRPGLFQPPLALPGPEPEGLARWLDADVAAELGCTRTKEES